MVGNGGKVLDVVGEVHGVPEGRVQSLNQKIRFTLILEADEELDNMTGRQLDRG